MKRVVIIFLSIIAALSVCASKMDSLQWRVGMEVSPAYVIPTNSSLKGDNLYGDKVYCSFAGSLRGDFSFNPNSCEGRLYQGLYQGIGVDLRTFFRHRFLGEPVSLYVYQGAPFKHFSNRLWLGYEWRFGAAMGWGDRTGDLGLGYTNGAISTRVTAHMSAGIKLHYALDPHWHLSLGVDVTHFSNGNTSFPNSGINTAGISIGAAYVINPQPKAEDPGDAMKEEADKGRWMWDVMAYGAWRKRHVVLDDTEMLIKGNYAVAGLQFTPMRKINRWFSTGVALDMKYDRSSGLVPYWKGGYYMEAEFDKPPFGKQLSVGLAAMAEFTMPFFSVSAGIGYNMLNPKEEKRFFQMLAVKAFLTRNVYLNVGYRLGDFKDPQNLMLGIGLRIPASAR